MKQAVFLDRDGTINRDIGYLNHPDQLELIPGAAEAIRLLNNASFLAVVITNQAGVAKGLIPEEQLPAIQEAFFSLLQKEGAEIDGYYFCPHYPEGSVEKYACPCECRKPAPGLLVKASEDMNIDLKSSYVVGDKVSDVQLAHNVEATAVLVLTGYGRDELNRYPKEYAPPHYTCNDLYEAVQWILKHNDDNLTTESRRAQRSKGL
jgi:D-glycero-D-manno-heptose 1,7-bisphosphate phosphatase